jgi:hypothetical protein
MKRTNVLWITGLVLGWLFDFLFWKANAGINFAIYVLLCLAGSFLVLWLNGLRPSWKSLLLLLPILFFAPMTFIRQEPLSLFLSLVATLGAMGVLAVTFLGGRWAQYSLSDYVVNAFRLAGSMIARPILFRNERKKLAAAEATDEAAQAASKAGWRRFWAIFRGVLIALPILVVFAALLSSADLVFAQRLQDFTRLFRLEKLPEYIFRAVYILIGAYALVGLMLHAAQKSQDEKLVGLEKPLVPPFLGFTEAVIILGAVILLFAAFVSIQFQYFFGGQTNIGIEGYTYAEYARRGFSELVTVAFFSLLLFLGLSAVVKRVSSAQKWIFSGLGIGMVALVGVMLVSAFQRLRLYEAAYGFSRLRMYTHVFILWLGLLLAVVVLLEILHRERFFALAAVLGCAGFAATLTLINVDATITRQNVARVAQGKPLDVAYLASLSPDAVPALVTAFQEQSRAETRDALGAALACRLQNDHMTGKDWRSFNFSNWRAVKALDGVMEALDNYTVRDEEWPVSVQSPAGVDYDCYPSGGMD